MTKTTLYRIWLGASCTAWRILLPSKSCSHRPGRRSENFNRKRIRIRWITNRTTAAHKQISPLPNAIQHRRRHRNLRWKSIVRLQPPLVRLRGEIKCATLQPWAPVPLHKFRHPVKLLRRLRTLSLYRKHSTRSPSEVQTVPSLWLPDLYRKGQRPSWSKSRRAAFTPTHCVRCVQPESNLPPWVRT